ncbi:dual specificity testis-specific protein kinase 1-like [Hydractinia symbiolongicarpus]|uniref:dual specificity testis-specific protein kinase 1-like n=1 Tax=Hydractinia symbiolongicarpus TaxID=13093 RepID=UPI00254DE09A|nr:dual specificity testis-specific protein kinase 1-like [Hydractinia symbiolongicarpus]
MELKKAKEAVERYKQIVASQKKTIHILREKNASMMLQCADFTKLKMFEQLGHSRSSLMVDASLFSSFFHNGDPLLQEQTPTILTSEVISGLASNVIFSGHFAEVTRAVFDEGDSVILKSYLALGKEETSLRNLAYVSHEARLLQFVWNHPNIVQVFGIVHAKGKFHSVLSYEGDSSIKILLKRKVIFPTEDIMKQMIIGLAKALSFLFDKGVLHNSIIPENVMVKGSDFTPVIIGFSFACRASCAKSNVKDVLKKLTDHHHVAPELYRGSGVSYMTDIYAFGFTIATIMELKPLNFKDALLEARIERFVFKCMDNHCGLRPPT